MQVVELESILNMLNFCCLLNIHFQMCSSQMKSVLETRN